MVILASILVMLAVMLVPTLRSTLSQRRQINDLRGQLAQQSQSVSALKHQQQQWGDPAYVEQQARERLKFMRVGETSYTVLDADPAPADPGGPKIAAPSQDSTANNPWYGQLWQSMVIADSSGKVPAKVPAQVQVPAKVPAQVPGKAPGTVAPAKGKAPGTVAPAKGKAPGTVAPAKSKPSASPSSAK